MSIMTFLYGVQYYGFLWVSEYIFFTLCGFYFYKALRSRNNLPNYLAATSRNRRSLALSRSSALLSRLLAAAAIPALPTKEHTMKYFGTVKSFDTTKGHGEIKQEAGGNDLRFETTAIMWDKNVAPVIGQRLSYDVGQTPERHPCALNLQTI